MRRSLAKRETALQVCKGPKTIASWKKEFLVYVTREVGLEAANQTKKRNSRLSKTFCILYKRGQSNLPNQLCIKKEKNF